MESPNPSPFEGLDLSKIPDAPKLKTVYDSVADEKPEQAAKVLTLSAQTGQHPAFVAANLPQAQQAADAPHPDLFAEIEKNHPAATKFLSDPSNMAVAQHDLPNVAQHSQLIENAKREYGFLDAVKAGLEGSSAGLASQIAFGTPAPEPMPVSLKLGVGKQIGGIVGDFVPMTAGFISGGIAGGPIGAGAGTMALPAAIKTALQDHIEKGDLTGATDLLQRTYHVLKESGKQGVVGALTAGMGFAAKVAGVGPLATLAVENATMTAGGDAVEGKLPSPKELGKQFVENGVVLGAMHGANVAGEHIMTKWAENKRVEADQNFYTAMGQTAEASKLLKLMPETHQDLIRRLTDGSPVSDVHVPVQAWDSHFQTTGHDPKDVAHQMGVGAAYTEAKLTGGDVKVPLDTYISKLVGTPHYKALAGDVKFSADGMTLNQLNEQDTQEREKIEKAQTALQPQIEADIKASAQEKGIFSDLHEQLKASGVLKGSKQYTQKLADAATLASRHYAVEAQLRGMEPQALYDQVKNQIKPAEASTGGQEQANPEALQQGNPFQKMIAKIVGPEPGQGNLPETRQEEMVLAPARYSKMIQTLDAKIQGKSATVEQVRALASNFKEDERKWTGLDKFLDGKSGQVPKAELIDFLNKNMMTVEDRVTGEKTTPEPGTEIANTGGGLMPMTSRARTQFLEDIRGNGTMTPAEAQNAWDSSFAAERPEDNRVHPAVSGFAAAHPGMFDAHATAEEEALPSIDDLDDEELEEKVKEQYEDEINDLASEKEQERIDDTFSDWGVTVAEKETDWGDVEVDDVGDENDGKFTVYLNGANAIEVEAKDEDEAREKAEQMINDGSDEIELNKYWALEQNGNDYQGTRRRNGRSEQYGSWYEDEQSAQSDADEANDRERENMYGNSDGSEYGDATEEIVQKVRDGELPLDGYENGAGGGGKKGKNPNEGFKWAPARYKDTGNMSGYVLKGAEPDSFHEIIFHVPQLEEYNASDTTHFGDISKGKDIGWTRTAIHLDDAGTPVRLANEFQNNRTQKGAAKGYISPEAEATHNAWKDANAKLVDERNAARDKATEVKDELGKRYLAENMAPLTELPKNYKIIENKERHQFGTPEEQKAAERRMYNAKEALKKNTPGAEAEYSAAYKALPDIKPGWGRGEEQGAKFHVITDEDDYVRAHADTIEEATAKMLEKINRRREEARGGDIGHAERIDQMNWVEKQPEYIAAREAQEAAAAAEDAHDKTEPKKGEVPDTPFKNNSYEFQFKGLLRWHVEQDFNAWKASGSKEPFLTWWDKNGIKKVGWTTGMQQAERNNRVDDVDKLVYDPVKQELSAFNKGQNKINGAKMKPEEIADKLGGSPQAKEIVKRLLASEKIAPETDEAKARRTVLQEKADAAGNSDFTEFTRWAKEQGVNDSSHALSVRWGEDGTKDPLVKEFVDSKAGLSPSERKELDELRGRSGMTAEHIGSHVIHDEGGIKVAANAKFYQDLYDMKIPSFVKKFSKQWGGTVGEAMIKTGEQEGALRYEGGEPGLLKLEKVGRGIAATNNNTMKAAISIVLADMKNGKKFSEAISERAAEQGSADFSKFHALAEEFGGKLVKDTASRFEKIHALNVTPEMARAAITQGFPLFQAAGAEGPLGEFNPAQKLISFFKSADVTTIPHELAHAWIEDAFQFVKAGQATEDYLEHWDDAKKWLGVKDDQETLTREQHEKFAQGFEKYMMEGKAPSDALRSVFYRMAQWMTQVYRQVKNSLRGNAVKGIELSDSARSFMDRLLASQDEIDNAAKDAGYNPAEVSSIPEGDPVGERKIKTLQERAHEKAFEQLVREKMEVIKSGNGAAYDDERKRVTAQHFNEVANEPVFRAHSLFNPEGTEERINQPDIWKEAHGYLNGKLDHETTAKWDTIAEMSGFSDAKEMAQKLLLTERAPAFEAALKAKVDASMEQFSSLKDPQAIRDAASAAVHNEDSLNLMALEQKILGEMTAKKDMAAEISKRSAISAREQAASAKKNAADILAGKPVKEAAAFRPYITAERKAAQRVTKAIAEGDMAAAAQAKGEQMLNHALYTEAFRNSKLVAKLSKVVDKYASRGSDMMGMPFGFMQQIDGLLESTGLTDPRPSDISTMLKIAQAMQDKSADVSEIANATGLVVGEDGKWRKERLPEFVARVNENYYAMQLPDSMTDPVHRQTFPQGMTMGDFRDLTDTMKTIGSIGRTFEHYLSSFIKGDLKTNAAALRAKIEAEIGTPYGNVPQFGELDQSRFEKAVAWIKGTPDGMITSKVNLLTLCEYLDRLDPNGPAKNNIYRPLEHAWNDEAELRSSKSKELDSIRAKYYTPKELKKFGDTFAKWKIMTPEGEKNVKLTKEGALVLLMNRGSESNLDRLTRGFGVNEEQIKALTDGLSKKDHQFAQDVLDYVNKFWPQAKALEMDVNGVEPAKVAARPIESAHGTFAGGYFPLAYDFTKSADAYKNAVQRNALYKQFTTTSAHTEQGAMKARVESLARPVRLDFSGLYNHLDDVIHDITHRKAIIDVARFLNQPDAKSAIMNAIGQDGYRKISEDLKAVASSQTEFLMPGEKAVRWFRFATTFSTLGYRFAIAPRRLTEDSMNALREVGFRNLSGSISDTLMNPTAIRQFVQDNSPMMRDRAINREADFVQMQKQWKGKDSAVKRFAFLQDTLMDQALSYPVWKATYDKAVAQYGPERARELSDEAIVKTFGSGRELDKVGAQRGGELNRMMAMYYSWHSMMFNRAWLQGRIAGLEYNEGNYGKALAIIASTAATTWLIPAAIDSLWSEVLRNNSGDSSDEDRKKRIGGKFAEAPFAYFPMGRSIAGAAIPLMLGERNKGYHLSPLETAAENVITAAGEGGNIALGHFGIVDEKDHPRFAEDSARAMSVILGVPQILTTGVSNFVDFLNHEGEANWRDLLTRRTQK